RISLRNLTRLGIKAMTALNPAETGAAALVKPSHSRADHRRDSFPSSPALRGRPSSLPPPPCGGGQEGVPGLPYLSSPALRGRPSSLPPPPCGGGQEGVPDF